MAVIEDATRVAQLNGVISEEEKKIEKLYADLGKAYFELHKNDTVNEFKVQINSINDSMAKIEDLQRSIKEAKGLISCPKCSKDMKKTDAFCTSCGYRVAPVEEPKPAEVATSANKCTNCGAVVPEGSMFCTSCGTKVSAPAPVVQTPEVPAQAKCTNCGAPVPEGSMFCTSCGTKVSAPAPVAEVEVPQVVVQELPKAEVPSAPKCTSCGAVVPKGSMFCTVCGTKVEAPKPVVEAPAPEAPKPVAPVVSKRFCTSCGKEVAPGAKFCIYCGNKQ